MFIAHNDSTTGKRCQSLSIQLLNTLIDRKTTIAQLVASMSLFNRTPRSAPRDFLVELPHSHIHFRLLRR